MGNQAEDIEKLRAENARLIEKNRILMRELQKRGPLSAQGLDLVNRELRKRVYDLHNLYNISRELSSAPGLDQLQNSFLLIIMGHLRCNHVIFLMKSSDEREFVVKGFKGMVAEETKDLSLKTDCTIVKLLSNDSKPVFLTEYKNDSLIRKEIEPLLQRGGVVCVPLKIKNKLEGIIALGPKINEEGFHKGDLEYLTILSNQVSSVIENARLVSELKKQYASILKILAIIVESKDPLTAGHIERVQKHACLIGKKMGLSKEKLELLETGTLFHDIGKVTIWDRVLTKSGEYLETDWEEMRSHPKRGATIIEPFFPEIIPIVLYHHERYDGSGYPEGLAGEKIPLEARIVCAADAYDAMTTPHRYRKQLSKEEALQELLRNAGKQFDPKVVEAFVEILRESLSK